MHVAGSLHRCDVADALDLPFAVFDVGMHRDRDVGEQRPRRCGPDDELARGVTRQGERDVDGIRLYRLVTLRHLVRRQRGTATRAVRQDFVAAIQQRLLVQALEQPPHGLDVRIAVRDVGVLVVEPVADAVRQRFPVGLVLEDAVLAQLVEPLDAVRLDCALAVDVERFLDFDLDRQAVRIPPRDAGHALPQHRVIAADQILQGARENVMDPRPAVGGRWAFEENERRAVARRLDDAREQPLVLPGGEQLFFQLVDRLRRI